MRMNMRKKMINAINEDFFDDIEYVITISSNCSNMSELDIVMEIKKDSLNV